MNKNKNYWKEYNAKRKEYLAQKARERRAKERIESIQPLETNNLYTTNLRIQPKSNSAYTTWQNEKSLQPEKELVCIQPPKEIKAYTTESLKVANKNNPMSATQEYNQSLEKLKLQWETQEKGVCYGYRPEPITKLHYCNACDYHAYRNETKPWLKVQKPQPQQKQPNSNLWSDYYNCKKPFCFGCQLERIKENEYRFCSDECLIKQWIIFQGHNFLKK